MILSKIFRHFGLSQEDETDTVPITTITELNYSNLKMMGLVLVNGEWIYGGRHGRDMVA